MTEKEVMKFVIERSNDPIIKNPVLREAMNKDLGPRNNYFAGGFLKAGKKLLSKIPTPKPATVKPSILRREAVPLNLTQVNEISKNKEFEQAWKNYKISIKDVGRRKYDKNQFFEIWARENMAHGGQAGQLVGTPTDQVTQFDRRIYETPEGEKVSEKSATLFLNGNWMNVPSIHGGKLFTEDQLRSMIKKGVIEPTSIHKSRPEAETAAMQRSEMIKHRTKGFKDGQLVSNTVDGSRPGYAGDETFLVKVGKPLKVNNVIEQEFIEVTGSKNRPETYKKTGVKKTLYKPQIVVGNKTVLTTDFGTKDAATTAVEKYRIKNPIKNAPPDLDTLDEKKKKKYLDKRERSAKISKQGGVESFETGNKTIHKGHSQNIDNPDVPIKPSNIIYTPQKINQSMAGSEGKNKYTDLDYKIDVAEDKIKDIKKSNMSGAKKKVELEKLDTKLMKYVDDSNGYKTVTLSGGNTYGEIFQKSKSMDMFDEFPDKTEKETKKFVNQYFTDEGKLKDKWTKGNISNVDKANIQKSYVFLENIKNAKTNAINENKASKFAQRMMAFCPAGSKRVKKAGGGGAGPTCSMEQAQAGLKKQADAATKASKNGKIPKKFGKLRSFLTFAFGVADPLIETLLVLPELFAGNPDAAIQSSSLGWFTDKGKFDLEKLKDTNPKAYQYLKDIRATKEYNEAVNTLDELEPFLAKAEAEGTLDQVNPEFLEQYRNAKKRYVSIPEEYEEYGYVEGGSDTPLTARVEFQQYLRDKVKSDYEKGRRRVDINNMTTQELKDLTNFKYLKKDPNTKYEDIYTAPTDLKSFIDQKGELGKDTMLQYGVRNEAERIGDEGVYDIFDTYAGGYAGVETPGELNIYKDLKTVPPSMGFKEDGFSVKKPGIKDVRDAYAELPKDYAGQLAALEKEELIQGLKRKGMFNTRRFKDLLESQQMDTDELYAQGGLANLMKKYND
jgi:hypothetical protein